MSTIAHIPAVENLELLAKQVVEGFIIGLHKSPYHGFSVEFAEHRQYQPGLPVKNIDWKVFARTDRLYIKNFEEETNLRCQIVIDASSSMYYPTGENNKINFSCLAAASLSYLLKKQRDAVGLSVFAEDVSFHLDARSSNMHQRQLLAQLGKILEKPNEKRKTSAARSLHQIADRVHKRSLIIIFSDMFDSTEDDEEIFLALQHLKHNKHEVILFHVVDKSKELDFEFDNRPYLFVDSETGEQVKLFANEARKYYLEQMNKFEKKLKLKCGQYKIDFVEADINKSVEQVLLPFLVKRSKMI